MGSWQRSRTKSADSITGQRPQQIEALFLLTVCYGATLYQNSALMWLPTSSKKENILVDTLHCILSSHDTHSIQCHLNYAIDRRQPTN